MKSWIVWSTSAPFLCCMASAQQPQSSPPQNPPAQSEEELRAELAKIEARLSAIEKPQPVAASSASTKTAQGAANPTQDSSSGPSWKDLISDPNRVKLYGFARLDMQFDDSRPNNTQTIGWILSEDPAMPAPPAGQGAGGENKEDFTMHPRLSRVGIDISGGKIDALAGANVTGKIEVDFFNNALQGQSESRAALRMRHAYMKLAWEDTSLLMGQTNDVISPLYPIVNADLVMWGAGNLGDRRPQVRGEWAKKSSDAVTWTLQGEVGLTGADDNSDLDAAGTYGAGYRDGETSGQPTFQARAACKFPISGRATEVGIWGHHAQERPDTSFNGENEFKSEALGFDVSLPLFTDSLSLKAEMWAGENVDDVRGGIFQGINKTTGEEIASHGGFAEIGWKATEHCTLYVGWSNDNPENSDVGVGGRAENQIWYAASRWNYKPVAFGLEYLNWTTKYVGFGDGDDNRIAAFAQYSF